MRKTRYWICDKCSRVFSRKKSQKEQKCYYCGSWMRKSFKYPYEIFDKRKKKAKREQEKKEQLEKRWSVCRTTYGSRLKISKDTKESWKSFVKAKQERTFVKRANEFINLLKDDIWSCPHQHGYVKTRSCKCSGGGMLNAPEVKLVPSIIIQGDNGEYQRSLLKGIYDIKISKKRIYKIDTFIHEIVHYIDDMNKVEDNHSVGSHSRSFYQRMRDLSALLSWQLIDV